MLNHSRWITVGVASGLLALMGASLLGAQQQREPRRDALQTGAVTQDTTPPPSESVDKPTLGGNRCRQQPRQAG
jgi:hypothetical protein